MIEFPTIVYRCPGACPRPGGTYGWLAVADEVALSEALAAGWFRTMPEAITGRADDQPQEEPDESAPPTRAELERRAAKIGLRVDGRWSDARLAAEIAKVV